MSDVLKRAIEVVDGDRQAEYGDPVVNFVREALVVAGMTGQMPDMKGLVAAWMAKKVVRAGRSEKLDTKVDIAGYAEIMHRIEVAIADGTVAKLIWTIIGEQGQQKVNAADARVFYNEKPEAPREGDVVYMTPSDSSIFGTMGTGRCLLPPRGWFCSRAAGHDGPCCARPITEDPA